MKVGVNDSMRSENNEHDPYLDQYLPYKKKRNGKELADQKYTKRGCNLPGGVGRKEERGGAAGAQEAFHPPTPTFPHHAHIIHVHMLHIIHSRSRSWVGKTEM
jgi:hypothetical protein